MRHINIWTDSTTKYAAFFTVDDRCFHIGGGFVDAKYKIGWGNTPQLAVSDFIKNITKRKEYVI